MAGWGSGRFASVMPFVPADWSVTTIAFMLKLHRMPSRATCAVLSLHAMPAERQGGDMNAKDLIEALDLSTHPEGGWYRETWRAPAAEGERAAASAVLYVIEPGQRSHWN